MSNGGIRSGVRSDQRSRTAPVVTRSGSPRTGRTSVAGKSTLLAASEVPRALGAACRADTGLSRSRLRTTCSISVSALVTSRRRWIRSPTGRGQVGVLPTCEINQRHVPVRSAMESETMSSASCVRRPPRSSTAGWGDRGSPDRRRPRGSGAAAPDGVGGSPFQQGQRELREGSTLGRRAPRE